MSVDKNSVENGSLQKKRTVSACAQNQSSQKTHSSYFRISKMFVRLQNRDKTATQQVGPDTCFRITALGAVFTDSDCRELLPLFLGLTARYVRSGTK